MLQSYAARGLGNHGLEASTVQTSLYISTHLNAETGNFYFVEWFTGLLYKIEGVCVEFGAMCMQYFTPSSHATSQLVRSPPVT
jgi:hypothetical protein